MEKKFNQIEYIKKYNKEHYKAFKVNLKEEEYNKLEQYLKEHNKSKATFLREAMKNKRVL